MELIIFVFNALATVVFWGAVILAGLMFLRVIAAWVGANPFGRLTYNLTRITEPLVRPMRHQFGGRALRYDLFPLLMGVMILVTGLFIAGILQQFGGIFASISTAARLGLLSARFLLSVVIMIAGSLYILAIFLRFFLPFFGVSYTNKFFRFIFTITEPLLKPLRRIFVAGMFDFSPLIAILIVHLLTGLLAGLVNG